MGAADEFRIVIMHPVGIRLAQARPVVRGALGKAAEIDKFTVDPDAALARAALELRLAETRGDFLHIHHPAIDREQGVNVIKIRRRHAPEPGVRQRARRREGFRLPVRQSLRCTLKLRADVPRRIHDHRRKGDGLRRAGFVADLRFNIDPAGFVRDGEIRRINVSAGGLEVFVKRQGLIHLAGQVQADIVVQAAVIRIERAPHPFEPRARRLLAVIVAVIHLGGDDVVRVAKIHQPGQVQAAGGDAVLEPAGRLPIHPEMAGLLQPLEFQNDFSPLGGGGQLEMFAIPGDARPGAPVAAAVADE